MITLIGIDPGISGAIVILEDGSIARAVEMPTKLNMSGKKKIVDGSAIAEFLKDVPIDASVFMEHVNPVPAGLNGKKTGMGRQGAFNYGKSVGVLEGVIQAIGFAFYQVTPAQWKRAAGLIKQPKDKSRFAAMDLWPTWNLRLKKHIYRAEAALIAHWGARIKGVVE